MFDWFQPNDVLWVIPAAPLLACLWIVLVGQVVRRQHAHRPVVLALAVSFAAAVYLLTTVVPGGFGSRREMRNEATLEFVRRASASAQVTLSVCTGALILGAAGLLRGSSPRPGTRPACCGTRRGRPVPGRPVGV